MTSRVGELLVKTGVIDDDQLTKAEEAQTAAGGGFIGSFLVQLGFVSEADVAEIQCLHAACRTMFGGQHTPQHWR